MESPPSRKSRRGAVPPFSSSRRLGQSAEAAHEFMRSVVAADASGCSNPPGLPADDRLLSREAPVVAGERARATQYAMTGDYEGDRIAADRGADRACGFRLADAAR